MTEALSHLSAVDHLRLQLSAVKAEKAQALAREAVLLFEREVADLGRTYSMTSSDSVDVNTGIITRAQRPDG